MVPGTTGPREVLHEMLTGQESNQSKKHFLSSSHGENACRLPNSIGLLFSMSLGENDSFSREMEILTRL